jgi:hypothetical protein
MNGQENPPGNSGQKTGQNQGLKTRQCDEWACLSDIGD